MQASRLSLAAVWLWGTCVTAGFSTLPALAQSPPLAGALTPAQGAAQALDRVHGAKDLAALNPCVTKLTAAFFGYSLVFAYASTSGLITAPPSQEPSARTGAGKAFRDRVSALMSRYSITEDTFKFSDKSNTLPLGLISHGHQFLADTLALYQAYDKMRTGGKGKPSEVELSGSDFPKPKESTFRVLSPTRVEIFAHDTAVPVIEARLEDKQWRIEILTETAIADRHRGGGR